MQTPNDVRFPPSPIDEATLRESLQRELGQAQESEADLAARIEQLELENRDLRLALTAAVGQDRLGEIMSICCASNNII